MRKNVVWRVASCRRIFVYGLIFLALAMGCSDAPEPADHADSVTPSNNHGHPSNSDVPPNNGAPAQNNDAQNNDTLNDDNNDNNVPDDGASTCADDGAPNACGGCDVLPGSPGASCGERGTWQCTADGELECKEELVPEELLQVPEVASEEEIEELFEVGTNSAVFHASFESLPEGIAVSDHGFCWSNEPAPTRESEHASCQSLGPLTSAGGFSYHVEDLLPGRAYYVRAYAVVVLPNALTEDNVFYTEDIQFRTLAADPDALSTAGAPHSDYVALQWQALEGASGYRVYRDGVELVQLNADATTYYDTDAEAGTLPDAPEAFSALGDTERVTLSWQSTEGEDGPTYRYAIRVLYPDRESALSDEVTSYRAAPVVTHFELSINNGPWENVGPQLAFEDNTAPASEIIVPTVSASQGSSLEHVSLSVVNAASVTTTQVSYRLRAVTDAGPSAETDAIQGSRTAGALSYQWERSQSDANANYAPISGATTISYQDTDAPADGSSRYYRLRVSAQGTESVYSDAVAGHRAALSEVTTLSTTGITETSAIVHGWLDTPGVPEPHAHGFCYGTLDAPSHTNDATCIDLGEAFSEGPFDYALDSLAAGTRYFVRAYAKSDAGTVYGTTESFWTLTDSPQIATSSRVSSITINWNAVTGAVQYVVSRDGAEIAVLDAQYQSFDDANADMPPAPTAPSITAITTGERFDGVKLEWSAAQVSPGTRHEYQVVAINADGHPGKPGTSMGHINARPVQGYDIKIGDGEWQEVDTAHGLEYLDADSPKAQIVVGSANASDAVSKDHVVLSATAPTVIDAAQQDYTIRARNAAGASSEAQASGYRGAGDVHYQWFYSDTGADGSFQALQAQPDTTLSTYNDASAPLDGSTRHYFVRLSAEGSDHVDSDIVTGYRAVDASASTEAATNVSTSGATLHGNIDTHSNAWQSEYGFCYDTVAAPSHTSGSDCVNKGVIASTGAFHHNIDGLEPGTRYVVRAFVTTDEGFAYGNEVSFWTVTSAPNVSLHATTTEIELTWVQVPGATQYVVSRDGDIVATLDDSTLTYTDTQAESAPPPSAVVITNVTDQTLIEGIEISWEAPVLQPGAMHNYSVIALNADELASAKGEASGQLTAPPITKYEIQIGGGDWIEVAIDVELKYLDTTAPNALIVTGTASASQGTTIHHVALEVDPASITPALSQTYAVRAISDTGNGTSSDTVSGQRKHGTLSYDWQWSADGSDESYASLPDQNTALATHLDTDAAADGTPRHYRVIIQADGADAEIIDAGTGYRGAAGTLHTLSTLEEDASKILTHGATLYAEVTSLGVPTPAKHGFCYGEQANPSHDNGATCTDLGVLVDVGQFHENISGLKSATRYYVRGYIHNDSVGAGYTYSAQQSFTTRTLSPENVTTLSHNDYVAVSWDPVDGASAYKVIRDTGAAHETLVDTLAATTLNDSGASAGSLPSAPVLTATNTGTETALTNGVQLSWSAATVEDGAMHEYVVIALNADDLESVPSDSAQGRRSGVHPQSYEVSLDGGKQWQNVGDTLTWFDGDVPEAGISVGDVTATVGMHLSKVVLQSTAATAIPGASVDYIVRAVNEESIAGASSNNASGNRTADSITYMWQRTEIDNPGAEFFDLAEDCATSLHCDDTTAPVTGDSRYYRLKIVANGVSDPVYSHPPVAGSRDTPFCGGAGTIADPYQICSAEALNAIGKEEAFLSRAFVLTENIDMEDLGEEEDFQVIGANASESDRFTGIFDGGGFFIRNLTLLAPGDDSIGLFGYISESAQIFDLGIEDFVISGRDYVGALVGQMDGGTISSVSVNAGVIGQNEVGVLVGKISGGTVKNAIASGSVEGADKVGGLAGSIDGGSIEMSYATAAVVGSTNAGGLLGFHDNGTVSDALWDTDTSGVDESAGGDGAIGLLSREFSTTSHFEAWNFENIWISGLAPDGELRPVLRWSQRCTQDADCEGNYCDSIEQICMLSCDPSDAPFGGGAGTDEDPWLLCTPDHMNAIGDGTEYLADNFKLMNNIDLAEIENFNRIGVNAGTAFTGTFDGNHKTLRNLTINRGGTEDVGLFGYVKGDAVISNLALRNFDIKGYAYVGMLVGKNDGGAISGISAQGKVDGGWLVGGLIGENLNDSPIDNVDTHVLLLSVSSWAGGLIGRNGNHSPISQSSAIVTTLHTVGYGTGGLVGESGQYSAINESYAVVDLQCGSQCAGLVGRSGNYSPISDSHASGTITGGAYAAGLVGYAGTHSPISNSFADANISGGSGYTGGLVGYGQTESPTSASYFKGELIGGNTYVGGLIAYNGGNSPVSDSFVEGTVNASGNSYVGGLIGYNSSNSGEISNCHVIADTSGGTFTGGLIGWNGTNNPIRESHAIGDVIGTGFTGGLVGDNGDNNTIDDSYSMGDVSSGTSNYAGGLVGYNRDNAPISNSYSIGNVSGREYIGGGVGQNGSNSPISDCHSEGHVTGTHGMVGGFLGQTPFSSTVTRSHSIGNVIGSGNFVGGLVGSGSAIYESFVVGNVTNGSERTGGLVGQGGPIVDSHVLGDVHGDGAYVGGLVGLLSGNIENSYAKGDVTSHSSSVGGLVGHSGSEIKHSYFEGNVSGTTYVGGLRGMGSGANMSDSYAIANVSGSEDYVGGLVGMGGNTYTDVWFKGDVSGRAYVGGISGINGTISSGHVEGNVTGTGNFVGGLLGNGSVVSDCSMTGDVSGQDRVGGIAGLGSTTSNCHSLGNVSGRDEVGGIHGYGGTISYSYSTGTITGRNFVGGISGAHSNISYSFALGDVIGEDKVGGLIGHASNVSYSYAMGDVTGVNDVGGLVGHMIVNFSIESSYARGAVEGDTNVGGLLGSIGEKWGHDAITKPTIAQSYSTGFVTGETNVGGFVGLVHEDSPGTDACYWDTDTSGLLVDGENSGATGLETAAFADTSSFDGWDFVDTWILDWDADNNLRPVHRWELEE